MNALTKKSIDEAIEIRAAEARTARTAAHASVLVARANPLPSRQWGGIRPATRFSVTGR